MLPLSSIATGFISPLCHAATNIIDNLISEVYHANLTFLLSVSTLLQALLTLPVLFWFCPTLHLTSSGVIVVLSIAFLEFFYVYPYYWSLKHTDTSVVAALFSLGKITVPFMAWLFLHEVLELQQYIGFVFIVGASLMLTFNPRHFRLNRAAGLMLLSSLMLAVEGIVLKGAFNGGLSWLTFEFYCLLVECSIALTLLAIRPRINIAMLREMKPATAGLILSEALLSGIGNLGASRALAVLPVTVMKALSGTQPLFVLAYATLLGRRFPEAFKESHSGIHPILKITAFSLMILGTILTLGLE